MLRFAESGGQYHASVQCPPGIWAAGSGGGGITSSAPARNGSTWAYVGGGAFSQKTFSYGNQTGMIAGCAMYPGNVNVTIVSFFLGASTQCDLRTDSSGHLIFTRNGTQIGVTSTYILTTAVWHYLEFKAIFGLASNGTCEVYVDGALIMTATSVTNATTTAAADSAQWVTNTSGTFFMDFYLLDTTSGSNTTYLGDITVAEIYPNAPGVNSAWSVAQAAFVLTSVATASGGTTVYTGTITNGANPTNAWQGFYFTISGFTNAANNGTWLCSASSATTITLLNASGVAETHAATCAFQNPVQAGIHGGIVDAYSTTNLGTRPPADNQYIFDITANDITDYAHQTLTLTGSIAGVVHVTQGRKDDAGTRQIQQVCLSAGTTETSATITLASSYQYFQDVLETDPHTAALWTVGGFNAATFGVKEIT